MSDFNNSEDCVLFCVISETVLLSDPNSAFPYKMKCRYYFSQPWDGVFDSNAFHYKIYYFGVMTWIVFDSNLCDREPCDN